MAHSSAGMHTNWEGGKKEGGGKNWPPFVWTGAHAACGVEEEEEGGWVGGGDDLAQRAASRVRKVAPLHTARSRESAEQQLRARTAGPRRVTVAVKRTVSAGLGCWRGLEGWGVKVSEMSDLRWRRRPLCVCARALITVNQ